MSVVLFFQVAYAYTDEHLVAFPLKIKFGNMLLYKVSISRENLSFNCTMACSMYSVIEHGLFISIRHKDKQDIKLHEEKDAKDPISRRPMVTLTVF